MPLDVEGQGIVIRDGRFEGDRYAVQGGRIRLTIRAVGGPYTLTFDRAVAGPQRIEKDTTTTIGFVVTEPGELVIRIQETGSMAILSVRGPIAR